MNVLISEDHELYRDGLKLLLSEVMPDVHIIESGDFLSTKDILARRQDISLVLFDIHIPGTSGLDGLKEIKSAYPALPVVVISSIDQHASIEKILLAGADGFISKSNNRAAMFKALSDVIAGEMVVSNGENSTEYIALSPRLIDALELLAQGLSNKEIAKRLNISPATARDYVSELLTVFSSGNRTQAVLKAKQLGFIME